MSMFTAFIAGLILGALISLLGIFVGTYTVRMSQPTEQQILQPSTPTAFERIKQQVFATNEGSILEPDHSDRFETTETLKELLGE